MGIIECPVCTLYLRADMSLEDHLETHPKEKVIKALVMMTAKNTTTESTTSLASTTSSNSATPSTEIRLLTPPNALMYHTSSGYENSQHPALPPPPPPAPIVSNTVPTAITVVKASDMGYPINNVMIVKSCSTKFVQQVPHGSSGNSGVGGSAASYTGSIDNRGIFIEHDRGGGNSGGGGGGSIGPTNTTVRRQMASSLYPRYTNERYSGPPPPYSTAISSTVSAGSQLQQSSITGYTSKYEQKHPPQPTFYPNPPPAPPPPPPPPVVQTPTISISHHMYQTTQPPPPPPIIQHPFQAHQHQQHQFQGSSNYRNPNYLQAQYTEKDDGNFVVTENPKKVVEYTENDEGGFMVIEKIVKSPPRIIQIGDDNETIPSTSKHVADAKYRDRNCQETEETYDMVIEDEVPPEEKIVDKEQPTSPMNTIEIIENDDGTFDDNQGSFGVKEMPKPMLIDTIGNGKKCNKFNLIVESSPVSSGTTPNSLSGPRKKPTSGLKVLSNVKVTTDLSQGIKDIILNLNCKSKAVTATSNSGASGGADSMKTSLISGVKPTAVINNNCQNELIINSGTNMPPIDLTNVNDIEIINDDEEDIPAGDEEECYTGSMEVKSTEAESTSSENKALSDGNCSSQNVNSNSRATPTPSVITSVIRMTPHPSPVVTSSPTPPQSTQVPVKEPLEPRTSPTQINSEISVELNSNSAIAETTPKIVAPIPIRKSLAHGSTSCTGSIFNKPPKKLTVKLKTPLPPAPPQTPPLVSMTSSSGNSEMVVPKQEYNSLSDTAVSIQQMPEHRNSLQQHSEHGLNEDYKGTGHECKILPYLSSTGNFNEGKRSDTFDSQVESRRTPVASYTNAPPESDDLVQPYCSETLPSLVTTKVEHDSHISETIFYTQVSTHCTSNKSNSDMDLQSNSVLSQITVPESSKEMLQSTSTATTTTTTTTTEVEYYNITFIDDEAADAINGNQELSDSTEAVGAHEVVSQASIDTSNGSCTTGTVRPELEVDQKEDIVETYEVKISEVCHSTNNDVPPDTEDIKDCTTPPAVAVELSEQVLKKQIKVEKVEIVGNNVLEELVTCAVATGKKLEHKIAKIEPSSTITSASACNSSDDTLQKDNKDFLEAGPSRANSDDPTPSALQTSSSNNNEATFLEYSAEYDDYIPVSGYGMPQEQIPLSWVQKFSPQYTPFDDQNSYMDLDMCSSKTNSNSVGGTSGTSGTGSGSSRSRIESIMDRAPSAESLNIRTDEKMPAKGEISEQESNGDMELSWNRLYPVHENIPIYPSSYDLSTAQECWNLSNRNTGAHCNNSNSSNSNNNSLHGPGNTASMPAHYHHIHHHQQQHRHEEHTNGISLCRCQ